MRTCRQGILGRLDSARGGNTPGSSQSVDVAPARGAGAHAPGILISTRCQLRFVQCIEHETEDGDSETIRRVAQVYRHSDGYPSSVIQSLELLSTLQNVTRTKRDPVYLAANFIFLNSLQVIGLYLNRTGGADESLDLDDIIAIIEDNDVSRLASLNQLSFLLENGVEDPAAGMHSDEEHLYVVQHPTRGAFDDPG